MKKLFLFCSILFLFYNTFSQITISGRVIDKNSGIPLSGAEVIILDLKKQAITDNDGIYKIQTQASTGKFPIHVKYMGYSTVTEQIDLSANLTHDFALEKAKIELKEVVVTGEGSTMNGYRSDSAEIGSLGRIPINDIPFSINITSSKLIENRSVHSLTSALQTNPTAIVVMLANNDGRGSSEMGIRGFDNPLTLRDGQIVNTTIQIPVEGIERLEVLNGLSGLFYGFQSLAGTINFVSKQPTSTSIASITAGQYNGGLNYLHADLGGKIDTSGRLTYRVNALTEDGNSYIQDSKQKRTYLATALKARLFDRTFLKADIAIWDLSMLGQQLQFIIDPTKNINVPSAKGYDATNLYGQPWTYFKGNQHSAGLALESKINEIFSFRAAYKYNELWRKNNGVQGTFTDNNGNYKITYSDGAPQKCYMHSRYAYIDANFKTWKIQHSITTGYSYNSLLQANNPKSVSKIPLGTFNISSPEYVAMPDTFALTWKTQHQHQAYHSVMIGDRITINKYVNVMAGLNYAEYHYQNHNIETGIVTGDNIQSKVAPSIALVVKPLPSASVYLSYMQGISAGGSTTTAYAKNVNEVLPPSVNEQYEAGIKATIYNIDATVALFNINKINEFLDTKDSIYKQDGKQVHKGIEFTATGRFFKRFIFIGGVTLLNPKINKAVDPSLENKTPANVPKQQVRAYIEYELRGMKGLSISASANYGGKRSADEKNINYIPEYVVYDAGLHYQPPFKEQRITFILNVTNIFNTTYWASYKPRGTVGLGLGQPRIISLSARIDI